MPCAIFIGVILILIYVLSTESFMPYISLTPYLEGSTATITGPQTASIIIDSPSSYLTMLTNRGINPPFTVAYPPFIQ